MLTTPSHKAVAFVASLSSRRELSQQRQVPSLLLSQTPWLSIQQHPGHLWEVVSTSIDNMFRRQMLNTVSNQMPTVSPFAIEQIERRDFAQNAASSMQ
jgi:hypothetical protein